MNEKRLEKAGLAFIVALLPSFAAFFLALLFLEIDWAFAIWSLSLAIGSSYFAAAPDQTLAQLDKEILKEGSEAAFVSRNEIDWELVLESLRFSKEKFQDYEASLELGSGQAQRVEGVIDMIRRLRDGVQLV